MRALPSMGICMPTNETESDPETSKKASREKSVKYPFYSLQECIDYLSIIHEIGGKKEAPIESVISKLGITSTHNRRYSYLTSSAENFGLIEKTKNGIKPTEIGTLILYPPNGEEQRKELLISAFKTPVLYQKIIERYNNTILPNREILKNIFYSLGIARIVLEYAVDSFVESARYANVLDSNSRLSITDTGIGEVPNQPQLPDSNYPPNNRVSEPPRAAERQSDIGIDKIEITTISGKKASILLPSDSTKEDIEKLIKLLRVFSPE